MSPACLAAATKGSRTRKDSPLHMIDILVYLFENYQDLSAHPKPDALARKLSDIGFEDEDISLALVWLNGLKNTQRAEWTCSPLAQRIYTAEEQYRLGAECLSFIMFLETTGVISPHLRELVIEYAMMLDDDSIPLDKFKVIVLMVLWSREEDLEPLIVEELLYDADAELMH